MGDHMTHNPTPGSQRVTEVGQHLTGELVASVRHLRRQIHRDPELGLANPRTRDRLARFIAPVSDAVTLRQGTDELSWLVVEIDGGLEGPTTLLRADTDALAMEDRSDSSVRSINPGCAHACGHDAHAAMLAGAAHLLAALKPWPGRALLLFQPGEEGHFGARHCLDDGAVDLTTVDRAFALHVDPRLASGTVTTRSGAFLAGSDTFEITITGRGGHASEPHLARDPIAAAAGVITSLQVAATRTLDALDPGVLTVTKVQAGTTRNVIPDTAHLLGTARFFSSSTRDTLRELIGAIARGVATAHGTTAEVSFIPGYGPTLNDSSQVEHLRRVVALSASTIEMIEMASPRLGSEDFSAYLAEVPGVMAFLGVRNPGQDPGRTASLHSPELDVFDAALGHGMLLHALFASTR